MTYTSLARGLKAHLGLEHEPVALAGASRNPDIVSARTRPPTSACSLWREAEKELFFAPVEAHGGCSVGAYVMGLPMSPEAQEGLTGSLMMMAEASYLSEQEVSSIPRVRTESAGFVYGPLRDFVAEPDCIIVWASPAQAMFLNEALGTALWNQQKDAGLKLLGRPACGAVGHTCSTKGASLSLGCSGMRLFTEIEPNLSLFVIPGSALEGLLERLERTVGSNDQMLVEYRRKKAAMAAP